MQTMFLFPFDDIIKRVSDGKPDHVQRSVTFIQKRMQELALTTFDRFRALTTVQEFVRVVTFLPKFGVVRKFLSALYSVSPTRSTSLSSSMPMRKTGAEPMSYLPASMGMSVPWGRQDSGSKQPDRRFFPLPNPSGFMALPPLPLSASWGPARSQSTGSATPLEPGSWYRPPHDFNLLSSSVPHGNGSPHI